MEEKGLIYKDEAFKIIGAAMEVHNTLGSGFLEAVYQEALELELSKRGIPYNSQKKIQIRYKDIILNQFYTADLLCYDKIINYIKATDKKLGILINFGEESLYFKRFPNLFPFRTNPQL